MNEETAREPTHLRKMSFSPRVTIAPRRRLRYVSDCEEVSITESRRRATRSRGSIETRSRSPYEMRIQDWKRRDSVVYGGPPHLRVILPRSCILSSDCRSDLERAANS